MSPEDLVEEWEIDKIVAVADLHLGNIRTDYEAIQDLFLRKLWKKGQKGAGRMLVVCGDLIDAANMYETQKLLQLPSTMDVQRILLLWLDSMIEEDVEKILVIGNHEENLEANNLVELLKLLGWRIYRPMFLIRTKEYIHRPSPARKFVFVHTSISASRGSRVVSKTNMLQFFDVLLAERLGVDFYIAGHTHKPAVALVGGGRVYVGLPAFSYPRNSPGEQLYNVPAAFIYYRTSDTWKFEVFQRDIDYILNIKERNYKLLLRVVEEYYDRYQEMIYENARKAVARAAR